jgi:hypothetical protein
MKLAVAGVLDAWRLQAQGVLLGVWAATSLGSVMLEVPKGSADATKARINEAAPRQGRHRPSCARKGPYKPAALLGSACAHRCHWEDVLL